MLSSFKSDWDEIWQDCQECKYASIDGVGFSISHDTFKMMTMTPFFAEKCRHLVSDREASTGHCVYPAEYDSSWSIRTFIRQMTA